MIRVGGLCPIFFNPMKYTNGTESDYIQKFHSSDRISIQVFSTAVEVDTITVNNLIDDTVSYITGTAVFDDATNDVHAMLYVLEGMDDGVYSVTVGEEESEPFMICSEDDLLDRTVLIEYCHKDNNSPFEQIFMDGSGNPLPVQFRIEGGFKPSGYSPALDGEQWRNQRQELETLYAMPYDVYTLTIGDASGVPYWMIRHMNRLLCVSDVKVNGTAYVRSDNAIPEMSAIGEDGDAFNSSVKLEKVKNDVSDY